MIETNKGSQFLIMLPRSHDLNASPIPTIRESSTVRRGTSITPEAENNFSHSANIDDSANIVYRKKIESHSGKTRVLQAFLMPI